MLRSIAGLVLTALLAGAAPAPVDTRPDAWGLPAGAKVLEARSVPSPAHAGRALLLWMKSPEKHPLEGGPDEPYTCPDETRGSYYSGPAFVSLVDVGAHKVLQTLALEGSEGVAPGHWRYAIDYTGRGGCVDSYDVRYDPAGESFTGSFRETKCEE